MSELALTPFDFGVLAVVTLSTMLALMRGAVREALSIAAWVGALLTAYLLFMPVRTFAHGFFEQAWIAELVAALGVFVLPILVLRVAASSLAGRIGGGLFGLVDRLAGAAFGAARGALIVSGAYLMFSLSLGTALHPEWVQQATLLPYVREGANLLRAWLPAELTASPSLAEAEDLPDLRPSMSEWLDPDNLPEPDQPYAREPY